MAEAVELALRMAGGNLIVAVEKDAPPKEETAPGDEAEVPRAVRTRHSSAGGRHASLGALRLHALRHRASIRRVRNCSASTARKGCAWACDGLGELYTFDPGLLIPDASKCFKAGAFELIGPWRDLGRWKRHQFDGVAERWNANTRCAAGSLLDVPWQELSAELQHAWLFGTGDLHITYTWKPAPGAQVWRDVRGHHPGIAQQVSQLQERHAAAAVGKVHAASSAARRATASV